MPHVIRLRGPWLYQVVEGECSRQPRTGKAKMPTDWSDLLGNDFRGRVRCVRHFGMPTGLDDRSVVWLVVGPADARGHITLNGERLTSDDPTSRFDITRRLQSRNELCIEIDLPADGMSCVVHLEI